MEYFKHDINASEDDKICDLLANGGYEMLGYYWRFIEYLYNRGGKVYKSKINSVAWSLHMDADKLCQLISSYDLFCEDDEYIFSKRVLAETEEFEAVGKRMAEIGKAGGLASAKAKAQAHAQAYAKHTVEHTASARLSEGQADAQQNKIKEKKIKEKKKERMNEIKEASLVQSSVPTFLDEFNYSSDDDCRLEAVGGVGKGVVLLNEAQMNDLLEKLSIEEFDKYVGIVAECELNGKPYRKKTHYQAILEMVEKDRKVNVT